MNTTKYHQTRQVILDLIGVLQDIERGEKAWKLHIDLACDKIERIWG